MSRLILVFLFTHFSVSLFAQQDSQLNKRLEEMLSYNGLKDIEKVIEYTYPGIFEIVPKELMKVSLESSLNSDKVGIRLDSLQVIKIFPIFKIDTGEYARVEYSMILRLKLKDAEEDMTDEKKAEKISSMLDIFSDQYGEGNVRFDAATGEYVIKSLNPMIAVKDAISPQWTFLNILGEEDIFDQLFSKEVINKLETFEKEN